MDFSVFSSPCQRQCELLPSLGIFRGEESKKSANQKQESPVVAMFVNGSGRMSNFIEDLP
jgi:hypothetical protein